MTHNVAGDSALLSLIAAEIRCSQEGENDAAIESLLHIGSTSVLSGLCSNPWLSQSAVSLLLARHLTASDAKTLVSRRLSPSNLTLLLRSERRGSVITAALRSTRYDDAQLDAHVTTSRAVADIIAGDRLRPAAMRCRAARCAGLKERLLVAGDVPAEFGDDEIQEWLSDESLWPEPRRAPRAELARLLWLRPSLLGRVRPGDNKTLITTAAGSPALTDPRSRASVVEAVMASGERFAVMALLANPRLDVDETDGYEDSLSDALRNDLLDARHNRRYQPRSFTVTADEIDPATLKWLRRRSFPSDFRPFGRPLEILELSTASEMALSDRIDALRTTAAGHPELHPEITAALTALGYTDPVSQLVDEADEYRDHVSLQSSGHTDDDAAAVAETPVSRLGWDQHARRRFLVSALSACGNDHTRWENLWGLLGSFEGSVGELLTVSTML